MSSPTIEEPALRPAIAVLLRFTCRNKRPAAVVAAINAALFIPIFSEFDDI